MSVSKAVVRAADLAGRRLDLWPKGEDGRCPRTDAGADPLPGKSETQFSIEGGDTAVPGDPVLRCCGSAVLGTIAFGIPLTASGLTLAFAQ